MNRWPDPVRDPLPVRRITPNDINNALTLTIQYLHDPEDPAFDQATFGFVCAIRAVLIQCQEILALDQISKDIAAEEGDRRPDHRRWQNIGEEYVVQKIARRAIDELRRWVPDRRPPADHTC